MSESNCVSQERLSLKPCGKSYINLFEPKCLTTFEAMVCSVTLNKIHVREMGRYLAAADFFTLFEYG